MSVIIAILKIVFILGFLILIHEGGHFLIAKLCKIKVNEFAIGFGPTIWSKQGKETKYALRLIPLGGFVNLEGEEERSENEGSFNKASIPKRIAVVAAGGLVNIFFAIIIYFALIGTLGNNVAPIIDKTMDNSNAQVAGLMEGDKIVKINGKKIHYKKDLDRALEKCNGENLDVLIERNGEHLKINLRPTEEKYNYTGIAISAKDDEQTKIVAINPKSPAEIQGLNVNDVILKINGIAVENNPKMLVDELNKQIGEKIIFTVKRNEQIMEIECTPEINSQYFLGVYLKKAEKNFANNMYYAFWETGEFASSIIENVKMLFTGNVSLNQMMGPIGIGEVVAKTNGFADFIYILAVISISLGYTNLLPFPPLDGGKIVLLLIEAIRKKPLQEKTEMNIQSIGFLLIIALSIFVTYNDILRIF